MARLCSQVKLSIALSLSCVATRRNIPLFLFLFLSPPLTLPNMSSIFPPPPFKILPLPLFPFFLSLGLTHAQERELASLNGKMAESVEDASKERKAHNQLERENATLQFSVKTLQQKHDELCKSHQQVVKEMQDLRAAPATSKDQAALAGGQVVGAAVGWDLRVAI